MSGTSSGKQEGRKQLIGWWLTKLMHGRCGEKEEEHKNRGEKPEKTMRNNEPKQVKGEKNEDEYDYYYNSTTTTILIIVFND